MSNAKSFVQKVEVPNNNNPEPQMVEIEKLKATFLDFIKYQTDFITTLIQSDQVNEVLYRYLESYKEKLDDLGYKIGTFSSNRNATQSSNSIGNLFENKESLSDEVIQ